MIKSKNRLKKTIVGMITFVLAFFLLPFQGVFAAPQEIKDDTDLSALRLYQFQLTTDNMSVVSKSSAVDQYHMNDPIYEGSPRVGTPMENFTLKVDKTKKADQTFDKPLSLKFTNAGTVNGKQVDAYLTINKVTLHYINNSEATAQMANASKTAVQFFNVSNTWGANQFEIGNIPYLDATHNYFLHNTFTVDADVTAELKYSDGSEPDMKLVMKPTDIDANGQWNTKEAFYVTNYSTSVDKRVMNNRNILQVTQEGDKTVWNAGPGGGTSGSDAENNISGLALRSVNNTMNFGYRSANHASATFSLYVEQAQFAPEKEVDPAQIPAQAGEAITYKTLFRIPKPGKEIIAALSSLDFVDTFDDRLDFKDLTVDANGVALTEGVDYTVEKSGQKVTVKMAAAYLNKDKAGTPIRITYNTVTNNKVGDKASGPIENIVAMKPDNLYIPSNKVTTTLLYNKIHEFESGTPGKTLPQEVTNLLPAKVSGLANGTTVNPTQPTTTKVSVPEGNWVFKGYDKVSEVVENGDVKFIGKWVLEEFTKPVKDVVDGTGTSIDGQETNANDTLTYTVTYTNTTDSARDVTITDNVPEHTTYVENSADNGGTLTGKTLTWTKNVASGETFKVTFQVKVDADVKGQRIDNTAHVDDGLAAADTNTTKNPTPTPKTGNVDVKYIDEDGNVLEGPTQVKTNAPVGEDYTTSQKTFDGYEFKSLSSDSAPANGKVTEGDSHVVYVYKKKTPAPQPKTGNVDVKYIDEDGNVLEGPTQVKTNAPVGEDYTTSQKTFDGYEFKALSSDSAPANGKVTEGDSHVVYVYKKKTPAPTPKTGNVDVKYIDEDGNVLEGPTQVKTNAPVGEDYATSQKTFNGYEFKGMSSDSASASGKVTEGDSHVVYVYKKKTPAPQPKTGNVDVKYIDEDGNVLEG
ncbi:Sgo0707 family adhesin, partial [Streptococcus massiliensis]